MYSLEAKRNWREEVDYIVPARIDIKLKERLENYALFAFKEFECRDIARIDFRISENNQIYLLEINPLPGLSPDYSDIVIMAQKCGVAYENLILSVLYSAFSRYGIVVQIKEPVKGT